MFSPSWETWGRVNLGRINSKNPNSTTSSSTTTSSAIEAAATHTTALHFNNNKKYFCTYCTRMPYYTWCFWVTGIGIGIHLSFRNHDHPYVLSNVLVSGSVNTFSSSPNFSACEKIEIKIFFRLRRERKIVGVVYLRLSVKTACNSRLRDRTNYATTCVLCIAVPRAGASWERVWTVCSKIYCPVMIPHLFPCTSAKCTYHISWAKRLLPTKLKDLFVRTQTCFCE